MQIVMTAPNSIGRIVKGDALIIDLDGAAANGQIVVCARGNTLEYLSASNKDTVVGRVIRFYADPPPIIEQVSRIG